MSRRFRLGVVLRLRELAEDAAQTELAASLRIHRSAVDAHRHRVLEAAVEQDRAADIQRASGSRGRPVAGDLADAINSVELADQAVTVSQERVAAAADRLLEARGRLAEATSRRKVVERLRDRTVAAERLRQQRAEDVVLNEVASTRHAWASLEETAR